MKPEATKPLTPQERTVAIAALFARGVSRAREAKKHAHATAVDAIADNPQIRVEVHSTPPLGPSGDSTG